MHPYTDNPRDCAMSHLLLEIIPRTIDGGHCGSHQYPIRNIRSDVGENMVSEPDWCHDVMT